jgi:hypothetical protein
MTNKSPLVSPKVGGTEEIGSGVFNMNDKNQKY